VIQRSTRVRLVVSGIVFALAIGACNSTTASPAASAGAGGSAAAPAVAVTVAMITHETPGDTYWDIIRAGANAAAGHLGVTLKYSSDPDFTKQATLVQNAIDSKVDGIAMTAAGPSALTAVVKAANTAGVPVVMFDSGIEDWQKMGAMMYFGSDEYIAGQALGKRIATEGGTHALCVIHQEGSTALEARCKGVGEGLKSENMQVNGTDDASVNASIVAKLQQDPSIDWIVTMGAPVALVALDAIGVAGSKAKVATFDLNLDAANAIKDGKIALAVDAQPYLQGYLAVASLYLFKTNGNIIGGGLSTLTGPAMVDASNIDVILPFAKNGTR
jgi:simple sugar transport system substrate-binding protein